MKKNRLIQSTLAAATMLAIGSGASFAVNAQPNLTKEEFKNSKEIYFQRCAGCHGALRKGATGKNLEPENMIKKGQKRLEKILTYGTEGGMNNFDDILTKDQIRQMSLLSLKIILKSLNIIVTGKTSS